MDAKAVQEDVESCFTQSLKWESRLKDEGLAQTMTGRNELVQLVELGTLPVKEAVGDGATGRLNAGVPTLEH